MYRSPFTLTVTVTSTCTAVGITTQPSGSSMCVTSGNASFTVVPSGTAPFTYQWQYNNGTWVDVADGTPAGATYTNATTATLDMAGITAAANYQYRVIITNCSGGNTITSNAATLAVNALPTVTFTGSLATQCVTSTTYAITGGAPAGGSYSGPGVAGSNFNASVAGAGTHTITYTYTDINGCINFATNTIIVNALPTVTFTGSLAAQCVTSTTFALTGGAPAGGTYSGPGVTGTNFDASVAGAGTHTLTYTYSDINGCTNTASNTITVNPLPAAPTVGTINQPTCSVATGSIPLSGLPAAGTWTLTRNPGGITTTGTGTNTTINGLPSGTYTFTVTDATATCTSPASANAVIDLQPETPVVADQTTSILSGTTFTVIPSGVPVGTTYTWTAPVYTGRVAGGSAQAVPQSSISGTLTVPSGSGTATYTVTPTSGACVGVTFTVTVTVTSTCTPVTVGTQPANTSMCETSGTASFTVVASGSAPFTYQWEYNNGGIWAAVANGAPAGASYTNANYCNLDVTGISAAASYQYRVLYYQLQLQVTYNFKCCYPDC